MKTIEKLSFSWFWWNLISEVLFSLNQKTHNFTIFDRFWPFLTVSDYFWSFLNYLGPQVIKNNENHQKLYLPWFWSNLIPENSIFESKIHIILPFLDSLTVFWLFSIISELSWTIFVLSHSSWKFTSVWTDQWYRLYFQRLV